MALTSAVKEGRGEGKHRAGPKPGAACSSVGCCGGLTRQDHPLETSWCASLLLVVTGGGGEPLEISLSLCLYQRLAGWRMQGVLGDGHSSTRAKSAPEVAKLVLSRQVLARPPLRLLH